MDKCLQPTSFLDFGYSDVRVFVQKTIRGLSYTCEKYVKRTEMNIRRMC